MGTYNIPRNLRGESRILYIFSVKSLITTAIGAAVGLIFYAIFSLIGIGVVGIVITAIFALLGFVIGTFKIPTINGLLFTKRVGGESIDQILLRYIKFKKNRKIYVYIAERTPWSNLPKIYGFADIFSFEITLSTCSITDSPPKPKRKLHIITLTDIALFGIRLICFIPFVSSIIPVIIPWYVGRIYIKIFKEWFE